MPTVVFYTWFTNLVARIFLQGYFSQVSSDHMRHLPTRIIGEQDSAARISIQGFSTQVLRTHGSVPRQMTLPVIFTACTLAATKECKAPKAPLFAQIPPLLFRRQCRAKLEFCQKNYLLVACRPGASYLLKQDLTKDYLAPRRAKIIPALPKHGRTEHYLAGAGGTEKHKISRKLVP